MADDGLGIEAVEHLRDFGDVKKRVDRSNLCAYGHHRHQRDVHLNGVRHHDDDGAGLEAKRIKQRGEAVGGAAEIAIGDRVVLINHRHSVRLAFHRVPEHVHQALVEGQAAVHRDLRADSR